MKISIAFVMLAAYGLVVGSAFVIHYLLGHDEQPSRYPAEVEYSEQVSSEVARFFTENR
jgi:hypothetical protein